MIIYKKLLGIAFLQLFLDFKKDSLQLADLIRGKSITDVIREERALQTESERKEQYRVT